MQNFRRLRVWESAHRLTRGIYVATQAFPVNERYGLTSQLRRASVSIAANIAEACGHHSDREVRRFFQMAMASASEVEYELLLAHELALLSVDESTQLMADAIAVKRMLSALLSRLRADRSPKATAAS